MIVKRSILYYDIDIEFLNFFDIMNRKNIILGSILVLSLVLGACSLPWQSKEVAEDLRTELDDNQPDLVNETDAPVLSSANFKKFKNYEEFQDFLKEINSDLNPEDLNTDSSQNKSTSSLPVLSENIALTGPDIIRSDGKYIYALVYNDVFLINTSAIEQTQALIKLNFPDRPKAIYVSNNKLLVIGTDKQIVSSSIYRQFKRKSPYTFVKIFDISNPDEPSQIRDLSFEGDYFDSRLINGHLSLFINNYSEHSILELPIPRLIDNGKILSNSCEDNKKCFAPDIYYFDGPYNSYRLFSVNTINLSIDDGAVASQSYLLNNAQNIYLAANNFYISYAQSLNELEIKVAVLRDIFFDRLSSLEKKTILSLDNLAEALLNKSEKREKIFKLFNNFIDKHNSTEKDLLNKELVQALADKYRAEVNNIEKTTLYRFDFNKGEPIFRAQGSIKGLALDNFSLHEGSNNNLQVIAEISASPEILTQQKPSSYNLYNLDSNLKTLGVLENLFPNEKIDLVRFFGAKAYLFGQDRTEISVYDIQNSPIPKYLGRFKTPNTYAFLHPYNDDTLIALDLATELDHYNNLYNNGLKLSLLDFKNMASPREIDNYIFGANNTKSLLFNSDEPFSFDRKSNIISVPAAITSSVNDLYPYFSGVILLKVDGMKFNLLGWIDHSDGGKYRVTDPWCGKDCYDNSVRRSFYLNEKIYTFSNKYLKINNLKDLSQVQSIKLIPDTEVDLSFSPIVEEENLLEIDFSPDDQLPIGPIYLEDQMIDSISEQDANSDNGDEAEMDHHEDEMKNSEMPIIDLPFNDEIDIKIDDLQLQE